MRKEYDRIYLYFPKDKTKEEEAVYTLLKRCGRHQKDLVVHIIKKFLGEENLYNYSDKNIEEIVNLLRKRTKKINNSLSAKELRSIFEDDEPYSADLNSSISDYSVDETIDVPVVEELPEKPLKSFDIKKDAC